MSFCKALTILQPFAHLIVEGYKNVENRTWGTGYRGRLYIHAGKGKRYMGDLESHTDVELPELDFGAILGHVDLIDCVTYEQARQYNQWNLEKLLYTEGPVCWILENPVKFEKPIPYRGAQGLWVFPPSEVENTVQQVI